MVRLILMLVFTCFFFSAVDAQQVIGSSLIYQVNQNPNLVTNLKYCAAHDTVANKWYLYDDSRIPGSRFVEISIGGDGNGIYGGSGTVPNGTGATLIGTMVITNPGGAGLHLNQTSNTHFLGQTAGTRVLVAPTLNQIQIFGNGTTPAETYLYDADASAPVIVRVPSVVNSGGYVMEWPATPPVAGEQLVYTGSNTYDWATKSKIVRFVPAGASPVVVSATFPAYQLLGGFNSTTNTPDWTIASNIDFLYTGTGTKTFVLRFTASGETGTGLPVEFSYEINSAGKVIIATELSANFSVAGQAFVSMAPSDTLRFYVRPTSGVLTGNITNMSGSLEEF